MCICKKKIKFAKIDFRITLLHWDTKQTLQYFIMSSDNNSYVSANHTNTTVCEFLSAMCRHVESSS